MDHAATIESSAATTAESKPVESKPVVGEDWLAVWIGAVLIILALVGVQPALPRFGWASPAELAECHRIRRIVFIEEQKVPKDLEVDGLDLACVHFLADSDGRPAGTARLRITDDHHAKAERVAVGEVIAANPAS